MGGCHSPTGDSEGLLLLPDRAWMEGAAHSGSGGLCTQSPVRVPPLQTAAGRASEEGPSTHRTTVHTQGSARATPCCSSPAFFPHAHSEVLFPPGNLLRAHEAHLSRSWALRPYNQTPRPSNEPESWGNQKSADENPAARVTADFCSSKMFRYSLGKK